MDIEATVRKLIKVAGLREQDVAERIGISLNSFSRRLNQNTLSAKQFFDICDVCGADARVVLRLSGKEVWDRDLREGRRVRRMVRGIVYDTDHAVALGNNFKTDDVPKREAYRDVDGNYFFADYFSDGETIIPATGEDVSEFLSSIK